MLEKLRDPDLRDSSERGRGQCVSAYVRHGDKGIEMRLVPFRDYGMATLTLLKRSESPSRLMFLGTEDYEVLNDARNWGTRNSVTIKMSNLSINILSDKRQSVKPHALGLPPNLFIITVKFN